MPNIFPQISFFTAGLSNLLIAFSPQKVKKMVTFFPVAAAPFASTKVAKTLSRSSLNRIKVFPLSSRQTSEEEDCGVLFSTITSYFPAPDFTETKRFPVVWHHASASRGKPASVATISRRSPSASSFHTLLQLHDRTGTRYATSIHFYCFHRRNDGRGNSISFSRIFTMFRMINF